MNRRSLLALPLLAVPAVATAQSRYPERPIRLIIPWPAGGSADAQLRSIGDLATRALGQPVVIENRGGAGGTLHAVHLAREARPDGYTLGQMHLSVVRRPYLVRTPQWDATTDFTHIIGMTGWLFGVAVKASSPFQTFPEMIAYARANPGKLSFATSGIATTNHLAMEDIMAKEGVELTHVPFRGASENMQSLLAGDTMVCAETSAWGELVKDGKFRLLCTWGAERAKSFPDAPTLKELGIDIVSTSPYGVGGPAGMDPAVVAVLERVLKEALEDPAHVALLNRFDMTPAYLNSADYTVAARKQYEEDGAMIRRLNLRAG